MNQEKALNILKSGQNVFLTGGAGTGKTYVLNQYITYLRERKVSVAVTASTGIAATHLFGTTIHSWCGMGIRTSITTTAINKLKEKKYLVKNMQKTHVLIIDEISMLHRDQLDMVNMILKHMRSSMKPFGGMQVIFSGDFFQLPPVTKERELSRDKFAFMSQAWVETKPYVCYLEKQYRQKQAILIQLLEGIRNQNVDASMIKLLEDSKSHTLHIEPTRLFTHNVSVDRINHEKLHKIESQTVTYIGKTSGNKKMLEFFLNNLIVPKQLDLKIGAKVMFLKNNHEIGIVNGTLGEVIDFREQQEGMDERLPLVKLSDGRKIIASRETWSIDNENGSSLVKMEQLPLRLAWAITVHKSQGMTLEAAEIDLSHTFEKGQGYVALSRLQTYKQMRLLGFNMMALEVDPLAAKADKRFRELSQEANHMDDEVFRNSWDDHILRCGGTLDPKKIKKNTSKRNRKEKKISTYQETIELIEKGMKLSEIATQRGLALSTIRGHILRIKDDFPEVDLKHLRPKDKIVAEIEEAYRILKEKASEDDFSKDGRLNSKLVYDYCDQRYDYGTIKLVYAFIDK